MVRFSKVMRYIETMRRVLVIVICVFSGLSYANDDLAKDIEEHFNLYLIKPDRRSPLDKVNVKGNTATLYYWLSGAKRKPNEVICDAYEYLLLGRTTYGKGIKSAFEKFPTGQKFELSLYDFEFKTKKGPKLGDILPDQRVYEYMKIGVDRASFQKKDFDRKEVAKAIQSKDCGKIGKDYIDSVLLKEDYFKDPGAK